MGKKSRVKAAAPPADATAEHAGEVGPRQPCPCGSGRRYKACHGSAAGPVPTYVARPFEGLPRRVRPDRHARDHRRRDRPADRCRTASPTAAPCSCARCCRWPRRRCPARTGRSGSGCRCSTRFGDPSRDLAAVLLKALEAEPGEGIVGLTDAPGDGPAAAGPGRPTRRSRSPCTTASTSGSPTSRTPTAPRPPRWSRRTPPPTRAPGWPRWRRRTGPTWAPASTCAGCCRTTRSRCSTRWPGCTWRAGTSSPRGRGFVGMFRAHGLLVPVWDLPSGTGAGRARGAGAAAAADLEAALADTSPLTGDERSARNGLANRQLTIR